MIWALFIPSLGLLMIAGTLAVFEANRESKR